METSPSQGVEVLVLADQDFEDMLLTDTKARPGSVTLVNFWVKRGQGVYIMY